MLSKMLADKNAYDKLMELKQKDLKLHQRLGQAIKKAIDKLAKVFGIYDTQNPDFQYAASVESFGEEAFRQMQDLYMRAFVQADANLSAIVDEIQQALPKTEAEIAETEVEQAEKDVEAEAMYSLRDVEIPTRAELEAKDPIKVVDIKTAQTGGSFATRRQQILQNTAKVISKPYLNRDTNTYIFLTEKSYTHAFNNTGTLQLNAAEHFPELIENAVLTHAEKPTHGSDYTDGVYTFFAAAKAERIMPVKLKVKEYNYKGQLLPKNIRDYFESNPSDYASSYDTVVLEVEEIEENPSGFVRDITEHDIAPDPEESSTITVADLLNLVKGKYEKYIPKFSDRDSESVSNRSLLANAFEGIVKDDLEKQKLAEYRENISQLDAQEEKLAQLNAQIKELSFAPGKRDTAKIRQLRDEATKTANRIGIYDQRLLRLEASAPLQKVLEREKKKAYQRAEKKGKEVSVVPTDLLLGNQRIGEYGIQFQMLRHQLYR